MNPHRCSLFVPGRDLRRLLEALTFGRASHHRFWRGFAARSAGGNALRERPFQHQRGR